MNPNDEVAPEIEAEIEKISEAQKVIEGEIKKISEARATIERLIFHKKEEEPRYGGF